jgi:hypothetical protein
VGLKRFGLLVVALAGAAALNAPYSAVSGQVKFQVSPLVGMYIPHGAPLLEQPGATATRPLLRKHPVGGPVFTTRLNAWFSPAMDLGVEASVGYSPGLIAVRDAAGAVSDIRAALLLASTKVLYRIDVDSTLSFQFGPGVGYVGREGRAWADTPAAPSLAVVLAFGARAKLDFSPDRKGPRTKEPITFRLDLEDYVSWAEFESPRRLPGRIYNDLIVSFGLAFPISGGSQLP